MKAGSCYIEIERAFKDVPLELEGMTSADLSEEQARSILDRLREIRVENVPFFLGKILCRVCKCPEDGLVDDAIEFLDFSLSNELPKSRHEELWANKGLDSYKETINYLRKNNSRLAQSFSERQARAIVKWLNWANAHGYVHFWRQKQWDGAIAFWSALSTSKNEAPNAGGTPTGA